MKNINKIMAIGIITTSIIGIVQPASANTVPTYTTSNHAIIVTPIDYETKEQIIDSITDTCEVTIGSNGGFGVSYPVPIISGYSNVTNTNSQVVKAGDGSYTVTKYYTKDGNYSPSGTWSLSNGYWNYIKKAGIRKAKVIGWVNLDSKWYHMDSNGNMQTGLLKDKGSTYYLYNDGSMATGWVKLDSKWYYMNSNGQMLSDTIIDGFKLGKDGAML